MTIEFIFIVISFNDLNEINKSESESLFPCFYTPVTIISTCRDTLYSKMTDLLGIPVAQLKYE